MSDQWYYRQEGQTHGPVPRRQLAQLAAAGQLDNSTLVWRDGLPDWISLSSLSSPGSVQPPPLPPPPPISPPIASRRASAKAKSRPAHDAARWGLIVGIGLAALFLAGAAGWVARGIAEPRPGGLTVVAQSPPSPARSAEMPRAASKPAPKPSTSTSSSRIDGPPTIAPVPPASRAGPALPTAESEPAASEPAATATPAADSPAPPPPDEKPLPPAENPPPPTAPPAPAAQPQASQTLFQEIDIERMPKFTILGTETVQHLQYQILSELRVGPPDERQDRRVSQSVLDARLVKSDDLSREMYAKSLRELIGWQFSYRLNRHGEVTELASGPDEGRRAAAIAPKGGQGFLVTTVMDEAGWKELAQISFFPGNPQGQSADPIVRQMTHDFGPLGRWSGTTRFVPKGNERGLHRIDYSHEMTYEPPEKDTGALPFAVKDARFTPEVAGGTIYFDAKAGRVRSAQDRFVVRGEIATDILGQAATVEVQEQQAITVRLHDQNPWRQERTQRLP